jgi:hypothetical protein
MRTALVVTSISSPNAVLRSLAQGAAQHGWDFVVAGDTKSPPDFDLDGCRFLSVKAQQDSKFRLGTLCPTRSYSRKNLAYLDAIAAGAGVIVETDDDNFPRDSFWTPRQREVSARTVEVDGWVNVYAYFAKSFIWPRGLPLQHARKEPPGLGATAALDCPVQQGLADANPDVDAVYRMLLPLPFTFDGDVGPVALRCNAWCPFNSQNTTFFSDAFALLYLPAHCSFRMTDIWRSFVAQRVLHQLGKPLLFHGCTVWQERNDHDLHKDFCDEIPGYQHNHEIRSALLATDLTGTTCISTMMERLYQTMIRRGWIGAAEEQLLQAWSTDLAAARDHPRSLRNERR